MSGLTLIVFALNAATPPPTAVPAPPLRPRTAAWTDPDARIKCKSTLNTGSLVARTKTCRTVAQWRKQSEDATRNAEALVDHGTINACGECWPGGG